MRISDWSSDVCSSDLLTDLNSRIPVVIEPAHYKAVLAGDNTDWPKLEYLTSTSSISPGDRVVPSGDGGTIPPGLQIGRASCRERVCQSVWISVVAVELKKTIAIQTK